MDRYDAIIVGAGVIGASTAFYYKKANPDHNHRILFVTCMPHLPWPQRARAYHQARWDHGRWICMVDARGWSERSHFGQFLRLAA